MARKGENIRKRVDGRWEARVIVKYEVSGKAVYKSVYGRTYTEVRRKRRQLLAAPVQEPMQVRKDKVTVRELMEAWLQMVRENVKESTYAKYVYQTKTHINPVLGDCCLAGLDHHILKRFVDEKLNCGKVKGDGGLSPKTVADILSIFSQAIRFGNENGYPCPEGLVIPYPKQMHAQIQVLSAKQQMKVEQAALRTSDPAGVGIILSLYTGLRIGEVCALKWEDVNLEEGEIRINKTLMRIQDVDYEGRHKTKILIDTPKSVNANRVIPIPEALTEYLKEASGAGKTYVLTGNTQYIEPRAYFQKYKKIMSDCGLETFNYHALRHTFATRCVEKGVDVKSLSEILGHADITTTLRRYVHPSIDMKRMQMERLECSVIQGRKKGQ